MKYNINNNNLSKLLLDIENNLEEKSGIINELLNVDHKYCKMKTDVKLLRNTLDMLKSEKIDTQKEQKILIRYNGNPCITLNLSILAVLTKSTIILDCNECKLGLNSFIIETVNNSLNNFQTDKLIYLRDRKQETENVEKIICIDDINKYNSYLREKNTKVKFYSFNYLDFYSDSDEFEEIEELIYKFAEENQTPIEGYSELEINEAIQIMENGLGKSVAILTNNEETKRNFQENLKNKKLYINKNPFGTNKRLIGKDIILM